VDIVFPELRHVFKSITCVGSLATLRLFPTPAELSQKQPEEIIQGWKSLIKRHCGLRKAEALLALASRSVGSGQATNAYKLHVKQLLEEYDLASEQLRIVEPEM
jgi:transposase